MPPNPNNNSSPERRRGPSLIRQWGPGVVLGAAVLTVSTCAIERFGVGNTEDYGNRIYQGPEGTTQPLNEDNDGLSLFKVFDAVTDILKS